MNGFALALLVTCAMVSLGWGRTTVVDVTQFGVAPDSGADATVAFQRAIAAAKEAKGPVTLRVPRGRYEFFPAHATRRACFFSNATEPGSDGMRTIAIDFSGTKGLTVEGEGARLVMRGKMTMLVAEHCDRLTLRGMEFDFARPAVSEIKAIEKGDGYWVGQIHPDSTYRIDGARILWLGENWSAFHDGTQHFDPVTQQVWRGSDPTRGATAVRELGERRVRFEVPAPSLDAVTVGRTYQFRAYARDEAGMWFDRSRDVSLQDVTVRATSGFGLLFQFVENVDIKGLMVAPDSAGGRTACSAADILHFSGCKGRVRVRKSVLSASQDDAINVHGTHLKIMEALPGNRLRLRFGHPQTWGFEAFSAKDLVEFVHSDSLLPYASAKVVSVTMGEDRHEQILELDRPLPAEIQTGSDALENVSWTPAVEVSGCKIAQVPTRGFLLTTRRPIRIVGNRFLRTPMPSILVEDDARGWFESGPVHDLLIRDNEFFECGDESIRLDPQNSVDLGAVHRNVRIEGNKFDLIGSNAIGARSTDGLSVIRNLFVVPKPVSQESLVRTDQCLKVRVKDNRVQARNSSGGN